MPLYKAVCVLRAIDSQADAGRVVARLRQVAAIIAARISSSSTAV